MKKIQVIPDLSKELILSYIDEKDIFRYYSYVNKIEINKAILSPLREENHPSACFFYSENGDLLLKDFGLGISVNCFQYVMREFGINYPEALKKIAIDFNVISGNMKLNRVKHDETTHKKSNKKKEFTPISREFNDKDLEYWNSFGIDISQLEKYKVFAIDKLYLNNRPFYKYNNDHSDPCYLYLLGDNRFKFYFPLRTHNRFLSNGNHFQGLSQVNVNNNFIVITKSLKDVMLLDSFNISSFAIPSENPLHADEFIDSIMSYAKEHYKVFILFDFDLAGIKTANYFKKVHNIPKENILFFTNGRFGTPEYQNKDFSDFYKIYGREATQKFVFETRQYLRI